MTKTLWALLISLLSLGTLAQPAPPSSPVVPPGAPPSAAASPPAPALTFEEYDPRSTLVVPEHPLSRAKFPFIDVHNHQRGTTMTAEQAAKLVADMDELGMAVMVNLSGGVGADLDSTVANLKGRYPERFVVFANIRFDGLAEPGWGARTAAQLERDVEEGGAQGLKIFKNLGMFVKDASGRIVPADDPRIDPVWEKCAELGIPVLIHVGEPAPFFEPYDAHNERWLELTQFPNRRRPPEVFGTFDEVMSAQHNLFRKHPKTTFINAHLGWLGHDLARLGKLMDELPNMFTEIGAVLAELGRQPRMAKAFLTRYQDRVLFGKDIWEPSEYHVYFRVLETEDEYFDYYRRRHAFWKMYGLGLSDEVLKKIYYKNALRIIPGLDASRFPPD